MKTVEKVRFKIAEDGNYDAIIECTDPEVDIPNRIITGAIKLSSDPEKNKKRRRYHLCKTVAYMLCAVCKEAGLKSLSEQAEKIGNQLYTIYQKELGNTKEKKRQFIDEEEEQ